MHDLELIFKTPDISSTNLDKARFRRTSSKISQLICDYLKTKNNSEIKINIAKTCLRWINIAFTKGIVGFGENIFTKLSSLEKDNKLLQNKLDECTKRCHTLEEENKKLHKLFDGNTFVGHVQNG